MPVVTSDTSLFEQASSGQASDRLTVLSGPTLSPTSMAVTFTAGDAPVAIHPALTITDRSGGALTLATVQIMGNYQFREDQLSYVPSPATGNIIGIFTLESGTLRLASFGNRATRAQWQAALGSVTYANTAASPHAAPRQITTSVNSAIGLSNPAISTITFVDVASRLQPLG